MKAVVMAGGEGSRLRPLTVSRPKPMVPIVGRPVMEHILNLLKRHGITDVVVTVQYMASQVGRRIHIPDELPAQQRKYLPSVSILPHISGSVPVATAHLAAW